MDTNLKLFKEGKKRKEDVEKTENKTENKLFQLEELFRKDIIAKDETVASPFTNEIPTRAQQGLINKLGLGYQDKQYGLAPNRLGDFSKLTSTTSDQTEAIKALNVQTLNSMQDIDRIMESNREYNGVSSQFSLNQVENKAFKKYKKSNYNKLASQYL